MEKIRCLFIRRDIIDVLGGLGPGSVHLCWFNYNIFNGSSYFNRSVN